MGRREYILDEKEFSNLCPLFFFPEAAKQVNFLFKFDG